MANLTHSPQAANVLHRFHRVKYVIYAEGQDDIPFWSKILTLCGLDNFTIKPAGSCTALKVYTDSIIDNNANIVVVRDCDVTDLLNVQYYHKRIIYTYGYSIENSLYHPKVVSGVIANYARILHTKEFFDEIYSIVKKNLEILEPLIILDLASQYYKLGVAVYPESLNRFFVRESFIVSKQNVDAYVESLQEKFKKYQIVNAKKIINQKKKAKFFLIKGHLLGCIMFRIIKYNGRKNSKKISISGDSLYASSISQIDVDNLTTIDLAHIKSQVEALVAYSVFVNDVVDFSLVS